MIESPARVMLTPSVVQPVHPLELNTIMVNKVDPEEAWQLWVSTLQSSRPTGHLGISLESELYLQPQGKMVKISLTSWSFCNDMVVYLCFVSLADTTKK